MKQILNVFLPIIIAFAIPLNVDARGAETYISETAKEACIEYGEEYNISPELIMAMIETESSGKPNAENGGCYGLMQIFSKYHKDRMEWLGVSDIFDERGNILVGTDYLAELCEKYEDMYLSLMIYHGESDAIEKWKNGEKSEYAETILERSYELEKLHGK